MWVRRGVRMQPTVREALGWANHGGLREVLMSLHIGELTSQVNVSGTPPASGSAESDEAARPMQPWDRLEQHLALAHEERSIERRTAGEGFDG
jgi:hypothetical protein